MSQALPVLPQLPVLDGRKPGLRPVDTGDQTGNRQTFGKLLDRFTQRDVAKDTAREPATEARDDTAAEAGATHEGGEEAPASDTVAKTDPADEGPEPTEPAVIAPTATPPAAELIVAAAGEPQAAVPVIQSGEPPLPTAQAPLVAAVLPSPPQQAVASPIPATADNAASITAPVEPDAIAMVPQPTAEAGPGAFAMDRMAVPAMATPITGIAAAVANPGTKPVATNGQPTPAAAPADAALLRSPLAKTAPAPAEPTDPAPQVRPGRANTASSAAAADPAAAVIRDERTTAAKTPEQQLGAVFAVDTPRSAAAQYHKVAETVRTAAAETPSPADQVSIRLLHAVAEGKRTIQMHLHPAELGTIDVKMQWQGDRLTAQFQVDRPETLQLLQREVPALERTLNQAGVNVDSGSLSFSLRQQTGNGHNGNGQPFDPAAANAAFGDGADLPLGDEPLGQVIRDGLLSIRV